MDLQEIKETDIWKLYEKGKDYLRKKNSYDETDKNHRFYNGNQWEGLKIADIEPVMINFIKPIVKYKTGIINQNLWGINYSAENFENREFQKKAEAICKLLNKKASRIWEYNQMDYKVRRIVKESAINSESIVYNTYQDEDDMPKVELLNKIDVYYANENSETIQEQPYILIKKRVTVAEARTYAEKAGVPENEISLILGDNITTEQAGEDAKDELDDMVTIIIKLYKEDGVVKYSESTKLVNIVTNKNTGFTLYPVAHFIWEEKAGSARGEGEVKNLIPNQIEVNKTKMRRLITVKQNAYNQKIVAIDYIKNPDDIDRIGSTIKIEGAGVSDVRNIVGTTQAATMSPDAAKVMEELITLSRELAGAGDVATGNVNPENASGRAIVAVQQAQQAPMTEQKALMMVFIEDLSKIWIDMLKTTQKDFLRLEQEVINPNTGESVTLSVKIPKVMIKAINTTVKIDVTPKSPFDKFATESTLENFFTADKITFEEYVNSLDDDSTAPKLKFMKILKDRKEAQRKIQEIQNRASMLQAQADQFINNPQMQQAYEQDMQQQQPPQQVQIPQQQQ